jgi:hypothetical protein
MVKKIFSEQKLDDNSDYSVYGTLQYDLWRTSFLYILGHSVNNLIHNFEDLDGDKKRRSPGLEPTEPHKYVIGKNPRRKYVTGLLYCMIDVI